MPTQPTFKRIATLDVDFGLLAILHEKPFVLNGQEVKVSGARLRTYLKGTTCVSCKIKAVFFAVEATKPNYQDFHLNLYATTPSGKEIMMTSDHIIPVSKGGMGGLKNRQPMCQICNLKKADKMPDSSVAEKKNPRKKK